MGSRKVRPLIAVAVANCSYEPGFEDPDALLARYPSLVEWAESVADAGAGRVIVVQRFPREARFRRGPVEYEFVADGAPPFPAPYFWGRRVADRLRRLSPDVVHLDGLVFPLLTRHLRMVLPRRTALVVQDHAGVRAESPQFGSRSRRLFYAAGLRGADAFIFTSREQAIPWQRARMISWAQPIHEVLESSTRLAGPRGDHPGALPGRPALLWVGRLNENKDPLTVLRGFESAAPALPDARLTLAYGEDPMLPEVQALIASSPVLRERVHLRGVVPRGEIGGLYASADVFVLGSHHESAGFALIEAMSFGVLPVVTDIPSFRIITGGGRVGLLFPPGDAPALGRALAGLAGIDLAGQRARVLEHFQETLSWPSVARRAVEVYQAAFRLRARATTG